MKEEEPRDGSSDMRRKLIAFSGIGFQTLITVLIFAYLGIQADAYWNPEGYAFSVLLTLLGVGAAMYFMIQAMRKL